MNFTPLLSPEPMHIPDGFLSVFVSIILWIASVIVVIYSLKRVNRDLDERTVPVMGILAAAIFAGQMLNFTVIGGTSGHLMGAALATILLGPWAAILVMTTVVGVQALIFQDGGLLVMGANIFNMAILGVAVSYMVYRTVLWLARGQRWGIFVGGFTAAWTSIEVASLAVGLQLALSATSPANIAIPAMAGIHALIGVGEGLITLGALALIYASRPDLILSGEARPSNSAAVWIGGLVLVLILVVAAPLASIHPDGLEWVAEQRGFLESARSAPYEIIPDYLLPGIPNEAAATIMAGIIGTVIVLIVALAVAYARRKKQVINHKG